MKRRDRRPSWWQLYLIALGTIGLLVLEAGAPLSERGHEAAGIGGLVLVFGLLELWLRINSSALLCSGKMTLVRQPRPESTVALDEQVVVVLVYRLESDEAETLPPAQRPPARRQRME